MAEGKVPYSENGISEMNGVYKASPEEEMTLYSDEVQDIINHKPVFLYSMAWVSFSLS